MALSEEEQRLLEQMEAAFAAEDPKFADTLSGNTRRRVEKRRAALAGLGLVIGLGLLMAGIVTHWGLSIVGFLVMLASGLAGMGAWKDDGAAPTDDDSQRRPRAAANDRNDQGFMSRFEERWNRRQNGEGL